MKRYFKWISSIPKRPSSDIYPTALLSDHKKTETNFRLNSLLLITDRFPNITRGPKRAMTLTITIHFDTSLSFPQSQPSCSWPVLSFLTFPLYSNRDSGHCWFVSQNRRIPLQNGNLLFRIEVLHGIIILSLRIKLIERSVLIIHSDSWIFSLISCPLVPLRPVVGLRPPSNSFILAFRLTIPAASLSVLPQI